MRLFIKECSFKEWRQLKEKDKRNMNNKGSKTNLTIQLIIIKMDKFFFIE